MLLAPPSLLPQCVRPLWPPQRGATNDAPPPRITRASWLYTCVLPPALAKLVMAPTGDAALARHINGDIHPLRGVRDTGRGFKGPSPLIHIYNSHPQALLLHAKLARLAYCNPNTPKRV